jgi:outer membrane receptor protein involved in Fe transport
MTPAIYATYSQPNSQITALSGGNPDLREETADTFTVGFVYQSELESPFLEGLNLSVDYYQIEIEGPIGVDAGSILYSCYSAPFVPANADCALITYSGADIYAIYAFLVNQVSIETSGVDFQVNWAFELEKLAFGADAGTLTFNYILTWLNEFVEQTSPTTAPVDFKGSIGTQIGDVFPEWKWSLTATWDVDDLSLSARVNHIAAMFHNETLIIPTSPALGTDEYTTLDVFASWFLTDHFTLRGGVLNATDEPPQLYTPNTQAGTDPSTYDVLGRRYFVGANIRY